MVFKKTQTPAFRFFAKVAVSPDGCWEWMAQRCTPPVLSYGRFWFDGKSVMAHRFCYELLVGPIPDGAELDHLCRNPPCVRPDHLEPVTSLENVARAERPDPKVWANNGAHNRVKTHCPKDHELTPENTYIQDRGNGKVSRSCIICREERSKNRRRDAESRRKDAAAHQRARDRNRGLR
jgi:hypothetical protein